MRRVIHIGEQVCVREECVAELSREERTKAKPHVACEVKDRGIFARREALELIVPWIKPGGRHIFVWPGQVRLYDGPVERLWRRTEKMQAEVQAMKARRKAEGKKKKKRNKKTRKPKEKTDADATATSEADRG